VWFKTPSLKGLPYDPALVAWYAADYINGYGGTLPSDGTLIASAYDLSGFQNHVVNSNASTQYTFKTNIKNGRPALYAPDGTRTFVNSAPTNILTDNMSVFGVVKISNSGSFTRVIARVVSQTGGETTNAVLMQNTTNVRWSQPNSSTTFDGPNVAYSWVNNKAYIQEGHGNASTIPFVMLNGSVIDTGTATVSYNITNPELQIGNAGAVGSGAIQPYWFEIMIYKRMLNVNERAQVRAYLNAKWAVY